MATLSLFSMLENQNDVKFDISQDILGREYLLKIFRSESRFISVNRKQIGKKT